jgi:uncharacterized protein YchJ
MPYLQNTIRGNLLKAFNPEDTLAWLANVTWIGLTVMSVKQKSATLGFVSFDAQFYFRDQLQHICEKSEFHRVGDQWFYVSGKPLNPHR